MSDDIRNVNRERILKALGDSFPSIYLTLISIIQGASLGYLAFEVNNGFEPSFRTVQWWLIVSTTLLVLITIWNEYRMGATVFVWIPKLRDTIIPFSLGISELLVIRFINVPALQLWFFAIALTFVVGAIAFLNMYRSASKEEGKNEYILDVVKFYCWFNPLYCGCCAVLSFTFGLIVSIVKTSPCTNLIFAALSLFSILVFVGRAVLYWNQIIRFAKGDND